MTVQLTAPVEGLQPGANYTGPDEAYLLASGYAKQAAYAGPGVANTGAADTTIANNREFDATRGPRATDSDLPEGGTNDGVVLSDGSDPIFANEPADWPLDIQSVNPRSGLAAGGTSVTIKGWGFTGATNVTFGGTAGTARTVVDDNTITVTTPAKAVGSYDVVVTTPEGSNTATKAFTYK